MEPKTTTLESNSIEEKNRKLCEKYPFLVWYGDPLYGGLSDTPDYRFTWEDELEPGWQKALCPQIWDDLRAILEKTDYVDKFKFIQIKEKWGSLVVHYEGVPDEIYRELQEWENKYADLSTKICKECGKPASHVTTGWISYFCEDCAKQFTKAITIEEAKNRNQII